ncbi:hypothetical protein DFJ74DRAFT_667695 [Hyaloraphidium curvatum]|nr:hypothetical protein DFJ74DRAFT_667695 [Hyaloraphidium curvatum]
MPPSADTEMTNETVPPPPGPEDAPEAPAEGEPGETRDPSPASLPAELVLKIAKMTPVRTHGRMTLICRAWHVLLLPYATARAMGSLVGYSDWALASADDVRKFVKDSFGTGKLRLVKELLFDEPEFARYAFEGGLVEAVPHLEKMSLHATGTHASGIIDKFAGCTLDSLTTLTIHLRRLDLPNGFKLSLPSLKRLDISGFFSARFVAALDAGCPALCDADFSVFAEDSLPRSEVAAGIPPRMLPMIRSWEAGDPELLLDLLRLPGFSPRTITHDNESGGELRYWCDSEDPAALWAAVAKCDELRTLYCVGPGSRQLLQGFPPSLEHLTLQNLVPSLADPADFPRVLASLRNAPFRCSVYIGSDQSPPSQTPEALRAWAAELLLWAAATGSGDGRLSITVDGMEGERAVAAARRTADFVEEALAGGDA